MPSATTGATPPDPVEELFKKYENLKDLANFNLNVDKFRDLAGEVGVSAYKDKFRRIKLERNPQAFAGLLGKLYQEIGVDAAWGLGRIALSGETIPEDQMYKKFLKKGAELMKARYNPQEEED